MNMRGPFGEMVPGMFAMKTGMGPKDRPELIYRGVRVTRQDVHDLTQVDEYPQATGWYIDSDGQLDVRNEDCTVHVVASYPGGSWKRVWFPGAEQNFTGLVLPKDELNGEAEEEEEETPIAFAPDDVEVGVYDDVDPD